MPLCECDQLYWGGIQPTFRAVYMFFQRCRLSSCHACRRPAPSVTLLAVLWKRRLDLPRQLRNGSPSCLVSRVYLEQA